MKARAISRRAGASPPNVPMPEPLFRNTSRTYPVFNMNIPDQFRAAQFIKEIQEKYVKGGEPFPRFIYIHLPNDHMTEPRPQDGYPYEASYVADNDYALGRIWNTCRRHRGARNGHLRYGRRRAGRAGPH